MSREDLPGSEEKRQAWGQLGWSFAWSFLLLAAIIALGWFIHAFGNSLPESLMVFLVLVAMALGLQLAFLYPIFFALVELFRIHVGRPLWRYSLVRGLVWLKRFAIRRNHLESQRRVEIMS